MEIPGEVAVRIGTYLFSFVVVIALLIIIAGFVMNLRSPKRELPARIVGRRQEVQGRGSDLYFVTFELEGGERKEFPVSGREYGLWLDGDKGILSYKGTWLLGWARSSKSVR